MGKRIWGKFSSWWAFFFYLFLTIVLTWPLILKVTTHMYATYGDAIGGLWATWWTRFALWNLHQSPFTSQWIAAPYGSKVPFLLAPVDHFLALIPNIIAGPIFAYNFMVLFSFIFAGLGMFFLVRHLTKNNLAALFAGAVFAFSPYHFVRAYQHWDLAQIQWIPFYVLFLLRFGEKKKIGDFLLVLLFFSITLGTNAYYMFGLIIITIIYVIFKITEIGLTKPKKLKWLLPITAIVIIAGYFVYVNQIRPRVQSFNQPLRDFAIYSLLPHDYIVPATENKYFGKYALEIVRQDLGWPGGEGNPTEKTAYLGLIPLALAILAIWRWSDKRRWFFLLLALIFFSISLKPYLDIGPWKHLPTGSLLIYKIAPFLRSVNRYSLFVQFSVATLAGVGLAYLTAKLNNKFLLLPFYLLLFTLVLGVEYQMPAKILNATDVPLAYQWLKKQPSDVIIMEFPTKNTAGYGWVEHAFYQTYHQKKLFNAHLGLDKTFVPQEKKGIWEAFYNSQAIFDPQKVAKLKEVGVKYIFVHPNAPFSDVQQDPQFMEKVDKLSYLKLVDKFPPALGAPFCCGWDVFGEVAVYEII